MDLKPGQLKKNGSIMETGPNDEEVVISEEQA
jgi:hypothetical protein